MPFTPLHMGPGLLIKALLQGCFSLTLFGWTQILMDIQPLLVMLTGDGHLHGFSHTYIGALLIAIAAAVTGKYLCQWGLRWLDQPYFGSPSITWLVAITSALIGSVSHVVLDSIMHTDIAPWFPFSSANGLLGIMSIETLHKLCLYSGLIGALLYALIQHYIQTRTS